VPWIDAPRVLLVTSDVTSRLKYTALFEEAGFSVYAVSDAVEALKTISLRMPDVAVLGSDASGPDCFRLLSALRADMWTADVPAVVLASTEVRAAGAWPTKASGATVLLGEGVPAHVVLAAVDDLTRGTPVERFARRQLRRTLTALRSVFEEQGPRIAAEETLEGDIARWSSVVRLLRAPVLVVNTEGSYVAVSRGIEALTGYVGRELTATSVFDTIMGTHLPFASVWQAHRAGTGSTGQVSIRDKGGRTLKVAYLVSVLTPHVHVLLLAPSV
jgi:PAS domain-containing protein